MRKMYKQPFVEVQEAILASATLMGSLNSNLKHPEDSGLPGRDSAPAPAKKDVF